MSEFRILSRPALAGHPAIQRQGIIIEAMPEGTVLHILSHVSAGTQAGLDGDVSAAGLSLRPVSPGRWFAVGDTTLRHDEIGAFSATLKPKADIVDQSHGRVRIRVSGPMAVRVLAKGTAVDLSLSAFGIGHASTTLIGHIAAHLTRTGDNVFELMVLRGFAESLWDELARMSLEFS